MIKRIKRRILLAGAELEGAWTLARKEARSQNPKQWHKDGSVTARIDDGYTGEYVSKPMRPDKLPDWVADNYPDKVNSSCGLHVHISTRGTYWYSRLMDCESDPIIREHAMPWYRKRIGEADYPSYLLSMLYRWGKRMDIQEDVFWNRLRGNNDYCRIKDINPDEQASAISRQDARYRAVNYCYAKHGTMEIRVLPCFKNPTLAYGAVRLVLRATEAYLQAIPETEDSVSEDIELPEVSSDIVRSTDYVESQSFRKIVY